MSRKSPCASFFQSATKRFEALRLKHDLSLEERHTAPTFCAVRYVGKDIALGLEWEPAERYVLLSVHDVNDGRVEELPLHVDESTQLRAFYLDTILEALNVQERPGLIPRGREQTPHEIDSAVGRLATAVDTYLEPILAGHGGLDEAAAIVKHRAQEWRESGRDLHRVNPR